MFWCIIGSRCRTHSSEETRARVHILHIYVTAQAARICCLQQLEEEKDVSFLRKKDCKKRTPVFVATLKKKKFCSAFISVLMVQIRLVLVLVLEAV